MMLISEERRLQIRAHPRQLRDPQNNTYIHTYRAGDMFSAKTLSSSPSTTKEKKKGREKERKGRGGEGRRPPQYN